MTKIIILIITLSVLLTGCMGVIDYSISKPVDIGKNYDFRKNGTVVVKTEGLNLYLRPKNYRVSATGINYLGLFNFKQPPNYQDYKKEPHFYVEILIKARKEDFFLGPLNSYLDLGNGKYLRASKYVVYKEDLASPALYGINDLLPRITENNVKAKTNEHVTDRRVKIPRDEWIGFAIGFETQPPDPGTPFIIELKGLTYQEKSVVIPSIKYRDKKITYRIFHQ